MIKWETTHTHITEEERADVLRKVEKIKSWISDKEEEQSKVASSDDPVFTSDECPIQTKSVESLVARLSRKPKPKPKEKKKNETEAKDDEAKAENETQTGEEAQNTEKTNEETETPADRSEADEDSTSTDDSKNTESESKE